MPAKSTQKQAVNCRTRPQEPTGQEVTSKSHYFGVITIGYEVDCRFPNGYNFKVTLMDSNRALGLTFDVGGVCPPEEARLITGRLGGAIHEVVKELLPLTQGLALVYATENLNPKAAVRERKRLQTRFSHSIRKLSEGRPGRPPEILQQHQITYYETILLQLQAAKKRIKSHDISLEWLSSQEEFAALNQQHDLVARLFLPGRDGEPARVAREYTLRQFRLNITENALEIALRRKKKNVRIQREL